MKFPSGGNMNQLMGQAAKLQQEMKVMQEKLAKEEYAIESSGGRIKVTVNGKNELLKLHIGADLLKDADAELLSDMIKMAVNQALDSAQKKMADEMGKLVPPGLAGMF